LGLGRASATITKAKKGPPIRRGRRTKRDKEEGGIKQTKRNVDHTPN
jgi:hypothetical protein